MSPTLTVSLNVLADLGLLALLTFLMSQARHLTPRVAAAGELPASACTPARAQARSTSDRRNKPSHTVRS